VRGDTRQRPGPGRPKKEYLEAMRELAWGLSGHQAAVKVLGKALDKGDTRAAQDVLNRAYGRPKEMVALEGGSALQITVPEPLAKRFEVARGEQRKPEKSST